MIVLDTNVLSEPWRAVPDPGVLARVDAQAIETLYLTALTVAELRFGTAMMPAGKRRDIYRDRLEHEVLPAFAGGRDRRDQSLAKRGLKRDVGDRSRGRGRVFSRAGGESRSARSRDAGDGAAARPVRRRR